jgi:cytochrome c peroxidase
MARILRSLFAAVRSAISAGSAARYWWLWACMALLLIASGAPAQAPVSRPSAAPFSADQEPITPIPQPPVTDPSKLALGKRLFEDPRLSHDGTRACLSCHDTRTNGASGNRFDTAPNGSALPLNTNTVFNAALSFRLNWEGNFRTLEAQAEASLENPAIMGTSVDEIVTRLKSDRDTAHQFVIAYGHGPDRPSLLDAIATYEGSLLTPGSRFDRWLAGDTAALSAEEQEGYRLFKTLGCVSCHQGVGVGGNLYQRHGIFYPLASPTPEILRVPSLRNVATTPPYFHDGSAPTLEDAVRRMGRSQLDRSLSSQQIQAIVAYLRSLTGNYRGDAVKGVSP